MNHPLVTICIPVFNGQKHLKECLDSCLAQQLRDYEIVICDDGSQDDSVAIVEAYTKTHSEIRFFRNEKNLGLVGNWNRCLEHSRGKWIKFVFQDDYITPDCLGKFVGAIKPDSILLVSERNFILPEPATPEQIEYYTHAVRTLKNTSNHNQNTYSAGLLSRISVQNMCMNFIAEPSLSFFKKESINQLGYFNPLLKQICDLEFLLRLGSNYGLTYVPEKICAFRIHSESTTSTNIANKYFELFYVEPVLLAYLLLYGEHFLNLRKSLTLFLTIKLRIYFRVKVYRAAKAHAVEKRDHYLFNGSNREIEEITKASRPGFFIKLLEKLL